MSKIEKFLIAIMLTIVTILATIITLIGGIEANGTDIDKLKDGLMEAKICYKDLTDRDDLFCLQKHTSLGSMEAKYPVTAKITINGNRMNDIYNVKNSSNIIENGVLAYILHQGIAQGGYGTVDKNTDAQIALWRYYETWYNKTKAVGVDVQSYVSPGTHNMEAVETDGSKTLKTNAENYANNLGTEEAQKISLRDEDKSKVKIDQYEEDGKTYLSIGYFRWDFPGNISDIKVYLDKESKPFTKFDIMRYTTNKKGEVERTIIRKEEIISGERFYLRIRLSDIGEHKIIGNIEATSSKFVDGVITANIWFLRNADAKQQLALVETSTNPITQTFNNKFDYDIPLTKDFKIIKTSSKKNKEGKKYKLGNVEFIVRDKETGRYLVKEDGERKWRYANLEPSEIMEKHKDKVITFKTKSSGKEKGTVIVEDLPIADYLVYEVSNPNKGYEVLEDAVEIALDEEKKVIENEYHFGKLKIDKVDKDDPNKKLSGVKFTLQAIEINAKSEEYKKYKGKFVGIDKDGNATYSDKEVIIKTNKKGEINIKNLWDGVYELTEVETNEGYEIIEKTSNIKIKPDNTEEKTVNNKYRFGSLEIEKYDKHYPEVKLPGVEFVLRSKSIKAESEEYKEKYEGKYIGIDKDGNATYSDEEVTIKTDSKGQIKIDKLWEGEYQLVEVNNPNYGYEIVDDNIELEIKARNTTKTGVPNIQTYIKLSGYIWKDIQSSKTTVRNDYYNANIPSDYHDDNDQAFNGIRVRLKYIDENGNHRTVKETISSEKNLYDEINGGEYIFEDVLMRDEEENLILHRYYIEFEYDGLIYQSVVAHLDNDRGSKATDRVDREILDKNFARVDSTGENRVNVNNIYSITYNETVNHETSIKDSSACVLNAKTRDAGYNIQNSFVPGQPEIKYINLGLYEKPQADIALVQDLENVNVGVNGYWHVYKYGTRSYDDNSSSWNVGVKFKNEYTETYKRAIYKSDVEYETEEKSKELQVYLTYKIALRNESSYLTKVNNIVDYFDDKYELVGAGTGLDQQNNITGNINCQPVQKYNNEYQRCIIDVNSTIQKGESNYIYIQFKLGRDAVIQIINGGETLYNRTEINSYTVYKDNNGNTVAALDKDSVPGNAKIENIETYEDDIDVAPPVQLEIGPDARKIQGTVFEDNKGLNAQIQTGEERKGNGILEEEEPRIAGVKVKLHELNNSIPDKEYTTESDGNFSFDSYIPGKYIITYTWGDKTYTVQNYKGTIYDSSRNQNDMYWYRGSEYGNDTISVNERKTDAIDDYNTRVKIDSEIASITNNTIYQQIIDAYDGKQSNVKTTKMDSTTPTMEFSVEYETTITDGTKDQVEFIVKNVDFGIVERARQQLDVRKRVKAFKITLANEQVLIDATVDESGNLQGAHNYLTYMGPTETNGNSFKGYIKAELDNELLQGARLEVTYEIKFVNNSEVDYMTEGYYKYGNDKRNPVTITPTGVVDYLDKNLDFEASKNDGWREITEEELVNLNAEKVGNTEFLNSRMMLYTENTAKPIEPKQDIATELKVSKLLTTTGDMRFNNDMETVTINKPEDKEPQPHRGSIIKYFPSNSAEEVEITPSTGEDRGYIVPIVVGMISLVVLGVGTFVIKKKLIDEK